MRCCKCGKKTESMAARVIVEMQDVTLSTIQDVGHCSACNRETAAFRVRIEKLAAAKPVLTPKELVEVKGNA
jgi:hypothetical protein